MAERVRYSDLLDDLPLPRDGRTVLVAVDGHGGSGKSTFAARLAAAGQDVEIVHTDDFAYLGLTAGLHTERLLRQVIHPLSNGEPARYQRFDWERQELAEWHEVAAGRIVVLEGVSSIRSELGDPWDLTVWVETPRDVCLRRGLDRDGEDAADLWDRWLAAEDEYVARDQPREKAALIVAGDPTVPHDPREEFVALEDRRGG